MQKIIIKIGTKSLLNSDSCLDNLVVRNLAREIKKQIANGNQVAVITSGAVAQGKFLSQDKKLDKRGLAALGQADLIASYVKEFSGEGLLVAQILLSKNDILNKDTYNTLRETVVKLMSAGIVPIINENDILSKNTTVSFQDNDGLAVVVALAIDAKLVINLSHVDGLYDKNPDINKDAKLIDKVQNVGKELMLQCDRGMSQEGSGGMLGKLRAMRMGSAFGITMVLTNGKKEGVVEKAVAGEPVGTLFLPHPDAKFKARDCWIVSAKISSGSVVVDKGAATALRKSKSLLAVGVKKIYGTFAEGEVIDILDLDGDQLAVGIVKLNYQDLQKMISGKVKSYDQEVAHANDLIIL
ncbi:MAG: glutamate 5-kinase [Candidatus Magasanikbacteria bacterium RIFOXYD2_FULL_41_14]|uniref:Glutamate 5-kinase n=1 Tax=Candidatus Magasanikbacteria bacterium RIFOXYD2_FULL_41_14 TaxID=1798709 RepID=A0A1F6PFA0_9BACT|nr:MAG: glutamate 5-kinase [Candidatus Magasanikbacteria bacterium RIFOXYD2_FULL_41_14]